MRSEDSVMQSPVPVAAIVIPAFNEAARIGQTLTAIGAYADRHRMPLELLVVDDGSSDATVTVARRALPNSSWIQSRLIANAQNRGKGHAVRLGLLSASAPIALFTDADLSTPISELPTLLRDILSDDADLTFGSRALDRRLIGTHQPRARELAGRAFNLVLRCATGLPFLDTQCGFKAFRMSVCRPLIDAGTIDGFGFDIELLYEAQRAGLRLREVPVRWDHRDGSKVHLLRDGSRMLQDIIRVRARGVAGAYDRGIRLSSQAAARRRLDQLGGVSPDPAT